MVNSYYQDNKEQYKLKHKEYYNKNREAILAKNNTKYATDPEFRKSRSQQGKRRRQKILDYINVYKCSHPCVDCGEANPVVLEFDHRNPEDKLFGVSTSTGKHNLEAVKVEIAKCDVRCANCHRRKTYLDRQSKKFSTAPKTRKPLKGAIAPGEGFSTGCE